MSRKILRRKRRERKLAMKLNKGRGKKKR